jgi:hypothetical protein
MLTLELISTCRFHQMRMAMMYPTKDRVCNEVSQAPNRASGRCVLLREIARLRGPYWRCRQR